MVITAADKNAICGLKHTHPCTLFCHTVQHKNIQNFRFNPALSCSININIKFKHRIIKEIGERVQVYDRARNAEYKHRDSDRSLTVRLCAVCCCCCCTLCTWYFRDIAMQWTLDWRIKDRGVMRIENSAQRLNSISRDRPIQATNSFELFERVNAWGKKATTKLLKQCLTLYGRCALVFGWWCVTTHRMVARPFYMDFLSLIVTSFFAYRCWFFFLQLFSIFLSLSLYFLCMFIWFCWLFCLIWLRWYYF